MAQAPSPLNRTNLAAITFKDGSGNHIRVYYQDTAGNIRETFYDQTNGWALRDKDIIGVGCPNTGIAATTWNNGTQIRVYFFSKDHHLVERCYEGGAAGTWSDGFLSKSNIAAAPTSTVAVLLSPGPHLEVYYQGTDGCIWQATNSSATAWSAKKINLPAIPLGSSIAATFLADGKNRRIYTTNIQDHLVELVSSTGNEWSLGATVASDISHPIGAGIACTAWAESAKNRIAVLSVTVDNQLVYNSYNVGVGWSGPIVIASDTTSFSAAACFLIDSRINTYFQTVGKHVTEYTSDTNGANYTPNKTDVPLRQ